jgi:hypothetical protein
MNGLRYGSNSRTDVYLSPSSSSHSVIYKIIANVSTTATKRRRTNTVTIHSHANSSLLRQNTTENQEYFTNTLLTDVANQHTRWSKMYSKNCNRVLINDYNVIADKTFKVFLKYFSLKVTLCGKYVLQK